MSALKSLWTRKGPPALQEDSHVFTDHVRLLAGGRPLDGGALEPLWTALRSALRNELRRRGLWESPPAYLGIYGWDSWETSEARQGALEELLFECYSYIFVSRLRGLEAQLKLKPNIDGLVFLNVRHFLHERQREHDPLGSQVFEVLRSAVRMAIGEGALHVLSGDEGVRNDTVLSFSPEAQSAAAPRERIAALVPSWNDDLLPDLVTLRGQRQEEVARRLRERLPDLRREGIGLFRFKDLVDPLKADVRKRWAAILDQSQGETAPQGGEEEGRSRVRVVSPDRRVEERQLFRWLVDCVLTGLRRLDTSEKTREYLTTLWQLVRLQASEGEGLETPDARLGQLLQESGDEERPSMRRVAEQLRIPRERLPGLYETLGSLLERCRAASMGGAPVKAF
ncbi:MAG TPA: hypothetical protein VFR03_05075 [Thermoanaerobaculia bacterium]|nr:hypothetical protein [Thermoanaerobaculia bacterium]